MVFGVTLETPTCIEVGLGDLGLPVSVSDRVTLAELNNLQHAPDIPLHSLSHQLLMNQIDRALLLKLSPYLYGKLFFSGVYEILFMVDAAQSALCLAPPAQRISAKSLGKSPLGIS
jgi:hypothetical protein